MKTATLIPFLLITTLACAGEAPTAVLPAQYTDLNQYVVTAPNQGDAATCAFMAATGAMEILLAKSKGISNPQIYGPVDLSERYTISAPNSSRSKSWFENYFLKFDSGQAVLQKDMPFNFWTASGDMDYGVWNTPANFQTAPRIPLPKIDTVFLFSVGNKYSRNVLNRSHVEIVKQALVQYQSPILMVGNDEEYWHMLVITGYDDEATDGDCYELNPAVCFGKKGAFYVRDSFGLGVEKRSYEWFLRRMNSAAVAKLAD